MNKKKKLESSFNDMTQEDENGVKFEDLLKTYTDESFKENQSIDEVNNKIIGDEKTFFNNSKIPKIEECNHREEHMKENDKNFNNINIKENKRKRNNFLENDLKRIKTSKINQTEEKDIFKLLRKKIKKKKEDDDFEKIIKSNNYINATKNYIFNIDKNYQRNLQKEKMYNFLFNEKINSNTYNIKGPILKSKEKEKDGIKNLINKLNEELKSNTTNQFYRKNNTSRMNILNSDKRNKSNNGNKNSYSKYYLSKLEMENKFLILQLSKRNDDFLNNKFFNINKI